MKENIIYTAGLFDGEGTVTLTKPNRHHQYRFPAVSLLSTTYEFISFVSVSQMTIDKKDYKRKGVEKRDTSSRVFGWID